MDKKIKPGPIYQWYHKAKSRRSSIFAIVPLLFTLIFLPIYLFLSIETTLIFLAGYILLACLLWLFVLAEQVQYKVAYVSMSSTRLVLSTLGKRNHPKTWFAYILLQILGVVCCSVIAVWLIVF